MVREELSNKVAFKQGPEGHGELKASAMALGQYMQDLIGEKAGDQCGCIRARHGRAGGVCGSGATV